MTASKGWRHGRAWLRTALVTWLTIVLTSPFVSADPINLVLKPAQIRAIDQRYGSVAADRVRAWQTLMSQDGNLDIHSKLEVVNRFFNKLRFVSDRSHWGVDDYWATPVEFLATDGGDCEDFAIAKYFTLRALGVPIDRMRITYVKAITLNQAHMVLAYYPSPNAEPLVLDNLIGEIKPASQRTDLIPVYSFNGDNLWVAREMRGQGQFVGSSNRIGLWRGLLERMRESPAQGVDNQ
jgi:predicted transglutaminase-like cysteine proteinase